MQQERGTRGSWRFARKIALTVVGVLLVAAGLAALVLPGPGLLILFVGVLVLSLEFEWAERRVDFVRDKAMEAAEYGVATWPRVVLSALGGLGLLVVGVFWTVDPQIPEIWIIGPDLPFGGPTTGIVLILSSLMALGLLGYSLRRFRRRSEVDSV